MLKYILANPLKSFFITSMVGSSFIDIYLKCKAKRDLLYPVYKKLISRSKPPMLPQDNVTVVPRPKVADDLAEFFLPEPNSPEFMCFGIMTGPSGSGKTHTVRDLRNKFPQGILYHKVREPNAFVRFFSQEIGMKLRPTLVLDLALFALSRVTPVPTRWY